MIPLLNGISPVFKRTAKEHLQNKLILPWTTVLCLLLALLLCFRRIFKKFIQVRAIQNRRSSTAYWIPILDFSRLKEEDVEYQVVILHVTCNM